MGFDKKLSSFTEKLVVLHTKLALFRENLAVLRRNLAVLRWNPLDYSRNMGNYSRNSTFSHTFPCKYGPNRWLRQVGLGQPHVRAAGNFTYWGLGIILNERTKWVNMHVQTNYFKTTVCVITGTKWFKEFHTHVHSRNFSYWGLGIII